MNIGEHLREARELRGMTLHQIADSTKLSATTLQFIERNEFNRLPGGIFAKGHLRAYAAEVGVEADEVVHEYLSQFPAATEELPIVREAPAVEHTHAGRDLLLTVAGIVVAFVAYGLIHDSVELSDSPPLELGEPPALIESVVTERSGSGRLTATERDEPGLGLEIQPAGACWLSAIADGRVVIYRLLQSGERVTIVARNELVLRVGDPAVFAYKLHGVSGRSLGEAGQPVTVTALQPTYNEGMDLARLSVLCRTHGVRLLLQFGSTVSGRTHVASDIDLAVLLAQRPVSLDAQADLIGDLQSLLPGREVDVALINGADPLFLKKITEQCRLLHGSPRVPVTSSRSTRSSGIRITAVSSRWNASTVSRKIRALAR